MADALQELLSLARAAVQRYDMIPQDSHIAVGVSGGKDSLVLLVVLARLREIYPRAFSVTAITLDPCFNGMETDFSEVSALCEELEIPHVIKRTRLWEVVFEQRRESNPCSLCARMRRGALHKAAIEAGCGVVALGHHKDDAAETFLMNLFTGGTLACFSPKSYLDRRNLTLIRPMVLIEEKAIARYAVTARLPVVPSRCPADGCTNRQKTKELLAELSSRYGPLQDRLLLAMRKAGLSGW